ncbi:serine protease inhibitor Kazal-type 1-like isoform X2 [Anarhichas minor]|uniref:serine protease inhibitor Kazal-type 1-like isoform X2 n=1 Tax=Anarhichas minor TaxID=65739 RepID=UPI003F73A1F0
MRYFRADRMLIRRLNSEQKTSAAVTTTEVQPVLYMTTTHQRQTSQPQRSCTEKHQQPIRRQENTQRFNLVFIMMFVRTLLLLCAFFSADAEDKSRLYRRPSCEWMSVTQACPLNYSPVCGSDGFTYPNECSLCVHRLEKNADILIVMEGPC